MAIVAEDFESATVAAVTTSNPAAPAFTVKSTTGTGTLTIVNSGAMHGSQAMASTATTTTSSDAYAGFNGLAASSVAMRWYVKTNSLPSSGQQFMGECRATGNQVAGVALNASNKVILTVAGTTVFTSTNAVSTNTYYRLELLVSALGNSSNGAVQFDYYLGDATSPVQAGYSSTTVSTGAGTSIDNVRFGRAGGTVTNTYTIDDCAYNAPATAYLGLPSALIPAGGGNYDIEVANDSPLGYWKLDESSGSTMADSSGNSHDGTYSGATLNQTALLVGSTASVKGGNTAATYGIGTVTNGSWMNLVSGFSVEAWVKPANTTGGGLVTRDDVANNGWKLYCDSRFAFSVQNVGDNPIFSSAFTVGEIYHVVGTYDGTTIRLYVNGIQVSSVGMGRSTAATIKDLQFGSDNGQQNFSLATMDNVAFYGSTLSAARVLAHYNAGLASQAPGSLSLSASATGSAAGSSTGSLTLSATATGGLGGTAATATGSLDLAASTSAQAAASSSGSLSLSGSTTAVAKPIASGSLSLSGSASASAQANAAGSISMSGAASGGAASTATGALTFTGSSGTAVVSGGTGVVGFSASAGPSFLATASLGISGSAGAKAQPTASGLLSLVGLADQFFVNAQAQAILDLIGFLTGAQAIAAATGTLDFDASVNALADAMTLGTIEFDGSASGVRYQPAHMPSAIIVGSQPFAVVIGGPGSAVIIE